MQESARLGQRLTQPDSPVGRLTHADRGEFTASLKVQGTEAKGNEANEEQDEERAKPLKFSIRMNSETSPP